MKKIISACVILIMLLIFAIVLLLTGCSKIEESSTTEFPTDSNSGIYTSMNTGIYTSMNTGLYYLYETNEKIEYVSFLADFDDSKYEMIDISVSVSEGIKTWYFITYKDKEH